MNRTADDLGVLGTDGFVVVPAALDPVTVSAAQELLEAVVAEDRTGGCDRPGNFLVPLRWRDDLVGRLLAAPGFVERIGAVTAARDLKWISGYVSMRPPATDALAWHRDWWCWDHPVSFTAEPVQVAVVCALEDTDTGFAALRVLPGSHRRATDGDVETHGLTLAVRAGDAVVIDYRLLHGTTANHASRRRDCVLLSLAPHWCDLPAEVRGHLVRHLALPRDDEAVAPTCPHRDLLPTFTGRRADLTLNWSPPAAFAIA